jgi:hypothetical protein
MQATHAMQTPAATRAFSALASKIHPQLPLTPRESQQLLNLLTSSFRAHLDREHPVNSPDKSPAHTASSPPPVAQRIPSHVASSHVASRHIDSILSNPLFAVKPHRRGSEPTAADVLRDPMTWFLGQIAVGAATLPKAAMCLDVLAKTTAGASSNLQPGMKPGCIVAEWLRTSGLDTSKEFLDICISKQAYKGSTFLSTLVSQLLAEGQTDTLWRWFIRPNVQRVKETRLDAARVSTFRQQLLAKIVSVQADKNLGQGLAAFMQAFRMAQVEGHSLAYATLRPVGAHLVNCIMSHPDHGIDSELYQSFLLSFQHWLGSWSPAAESMLWLHHPTAPSALPGLRFIQDPAGAVKFVPGARSSRRQFLVRLSLGVARQLLAEEKYTEAQVAMEFTKEHFADLVMSKTQSAAPQTESQLRERLERDNLKLLDGLALT